MLFKKANLLNNLFWKICEPRSFMKGKSHLIRLGKSLHASEFFKGQVSKKCLKQVKKGVSPEVWTQDSPPFRLLPRKMK